MKNNVKHILIVLLIGLSIPCSAHNHGLKNTLTVSDAVIRPLLPGQTNTAAYLTINNPSNKDCLLLEVDSPHAKAVEFHTHHYEQGMVKMRPLETLQLNAGSSLTFEPGGLHLMLFGVKVNQKSHGGTKINIHTDHCGTISFDAAQTKVIVKAKGGMHH